MDDNEIISIIAVVLLIIAFVMYVEIVKFAHFLGAGVGVTFWALIENHLYCSARSLFISSFICVSCFDSFLPGFIK